MRSIRFFTICLAVIAFVGMSFTTDLTPPKKIDLTKSIVTWKGYKVTGSHEGTIQIKEANLDYDNGMLKGGQFTIDMTSIKCTDLEGDYGNKLVGHLKSDDFFGVNQFPDAVFKITKVASRGKAGEYKITGDITIKGTTKEIKFNAMTDASGALMADVTIDRTDYNVRYGSGSFFDNLGDKTIYDEFELKVKLVESN
ncbi:MAG: YceI family protein [Bacteroidota bacterium]